VGASAFSGSFTSQAVTAKMNKRPHTRRLIFFIIPFLLSSEVCLNVRQCKASKKNLPEKYIPLRIRVALLDEQLS
jgi:hypothetical protein